MGDVNLGPALRPIEERFWPKVDKRGPDECWPWVGATTGRYGIIGSGHGASHGGHNRQATHVSWEIATGRPFPVGMVARHSCDNPPCVNPAHLSVGTQADNLADMKARGRSLSGVRNPMYGRRVAEKCGLSDDQVRAVRREHGPKMGYRRLAQRYGVDRTTIARILTGESYKDVA